MLIDINTTYEILYKAKPGKIFTGICIIGDIEFCSIRNFIRCDGSTCVAVILIHGLFIYLDKEVIEGIELHDIQQK